MATFNFDGTTTKTKAFDPFVDVLNIDLLSAAGTSVKDIPEAAASAPVKPDAPAVRTPVVKSELEKVGRNDPCPCGSGRKFKQCHGGPGAAR